MHSTVHDSSISTHTAGDPPRTVRPHDGKLSRAIARDDPAHARARVIMPALASALGLIPLARARATPRARARVVAPRVRVDSGEE